MFDTLNLLKICGMLLVNSLTRFLYINSIGLNMNSRFILYYSCLAIHVYRVVAVCFVILMVKKRVKVPPKFQGSKEELKLLAVLLPNFVLLISLHLNM